MSFDVKNLIKLLQIDLYWAEQNSENISSVVYTRQTCCIRQKIKYLENLSSKENESCSNVIVKRTLTLSVARDENGLVEYCCTLDNRHGLYEVGSSKSDAVLQFLISAPTRNLSGNYHDYEIIGW